MNKILFLTLACLCTYSTTVTAGEGDNKTQKTKTMLDLQNQVLKKLVVLEALLDKGAVTIKLKEPLSPTSFNNKVNSMLDDLINSPQLDAMLQNRERAALD